MSKVVDLLGDKTSYYLDHTCKTIDKVVDLYTFTGYY